MSTTIIVVFIIVFVGVIGFKILTSKQANDFMKKDSRFTNAKKFEAAMGNFVMISESGLIALKNMLLPEFKVVNINDINGFEVIKNGVAAWKLTRAVAGGLLFGGVGAIVGSMTGSEKINQLSMIFYLNDFNTPSVEIKFLDAKTKSGSMIDKMIQGKVQQITGALKFLEEKYKS